MSNSVERAAGALRGILFAGLLASGLTACAGAPDRSPLAAPGFQQVGVASWYGEAYQGRRTASGERFDMNRASAAHPSLPLVSLVEVTNLENGRRVRVRVNDRLPRRSGRVIDLSRSAAEQLGFARAGLAKVRLLYLGPAGPAPTLVGALDRPAVADVDGIARVAPN